MNNNILGIIGGILGIISTIYTIIKSIISAVYKRKNHINFFKNKYNKINRIIFKKRKKKDNIYNPCRTIYGVSQWKIGKPFIIGFHSKMDPYDYFEIFKKILYEYIEQLINIKSPLSKKWKNEINFFIKSIKIYITDYTKFINKLNNIEYNVTSSNGNKYKVFLNYKIDLKSNILILNEMKNLKNEINNNLNSWSDIDIINNIINSVKIKLRKHISFPQLNNTEIVGFYEYDKYDEIEISLNNKKVFKNLYNHEKNNEYNINNMTNLINKIEKKRICYQN